MFAFVDSTSWLSEMLLATWSILVDSAIYVLAGFVFAAILHAWVAGAWTRRFLSGRSSKSVVLATLIGAPLPLCSCGVLPTAVALRRKGASKGATLSFLISTPETSVTSVLLTYALLGPVLTIVRPVAACITAIIAGVSENLLDRDTQPPAADPPAASTCCCSGGGGAAESTPQDLTEPERRSLADGFRYAFSELFDSIFWWIIIGVAAAGVIQALVPASFFETVFAGTLVSMLLMLIIGIPMYICAEGSTPIAAALLMQGVSPGAVLVLLLVGPATNMGSVGVLYRELGLRTVVIYLATIAVSALLIGLALNGLANYLPVQALHPEEHAALLPTWLKVAGAIGFLVFGIYRQVRARMSPRLVVAPDAQA